MERLANRGGCGDRPGRGHGRLSHTPDRKAGLENKLLITQRLVREHGDYPGLLSHFIFLILTLSFLVIS